MQLKSMQSNIAVENAYHFVLFSALIVASCDIDPKISITNLRTWSVLFILQVSVNDIFWCVPLG